MVENKAGKGIKVFFLLVVLQPGCFIKMCEKIEIGQLRIYEEAAVFTCYNLVVFFMRLCYIAYNCFQNIIEGYHTLQCTVFIHNKGIVNLGALELLQHMVSCVIF